MIFLSVLIFSSEVNSSIVSGAVSLLITGFLIWEGMKKQAKDREKGLEDLRIQLENELKKISEQSEEDRLMKFWELQLKLYMEAAKCAAMLGNREIGSPDYIQAKNRFWDLYHGELVVVETTDVAGAMVNVSTALKAYEGNPEISEKEALLARARELGKKCRASSKLFHYSEKIRTSTDSKKM